MFIPAMPSALKPELIIMSTWDIDGGYDNRICGHIYEVIEYFWILKDWFDTKFIFPDNIPIEKVLDKYTFSREERDQIIESAIPQPKNGLINTQQGIGLVLIVDGNLGNFKGVIRGIPIQFSCGKTGLLPSRQSAQHFYLQHQDWYLLHDFRIADPFNDYDEYVTYPVDPARVYGYNKKLLLSYLDDVTPSFQFMEARQPATFMMYLTGNCKRLSPRQISEILKKYNINTADRLLIITDYDIDKMEITHPNNNIEIKSFYHRLEPIDLFQLEWTHYIYTPVERKWDCSNRLIPECVKHNRYVLFEKLGYEDKALRIRMEDSNFTYRDIRDRGLCKDTKYIHRENLNLCKDDTIIDMLMDIVNIEHNKRGFPYPFDPRGIRAFLFQYGVKEDITECYKRMLNSSANISYQEES